MRDKYTYYNKNRISGPLLYLSGTAVFPINVNVDEVDGTAIGKL